MKRILSLVLALMLFLLPAASLAEAQEAAEEEVVTEETIGEDGLDVESSNLQDAILEQLGGSNFALKYMLQGQELTTDVQVIPSAVVLSMIPEEFQQAASDLFQALTFRSTIQMTENQAQASETLMLNGEAAVGLTVAGNSDGVYATSNLLGSTIVRLTRAQAKELVKQAFQQAIDQGVMTQSQADTLVSIARQLKNDPEALLAKAFGDADITPLLMQAFQMMSRITEEAVTEAPEFFPEAAVVITVPLMKEDLNALGAELAKFLLDMPAVQRVLPHVTINDAPMTAERLTNRLSILGDVLAEDAVLQVYLNETGNVIYLKADMILKDGEKNVNCGMAGKMEISETGAVTLDMSSVTTDGDTSVTIYAVANGVKEDDTTTVYVHVTSDLTQGETSFQPVEEEVVMIIMETETAVSELIEGVYRIKTDAESDPIGVTFAGAMGSEDLGDHAAGSFSLSFGLEGMGDLIQIVGAQSTDLAEAYIITEDAVEPLSMSEDELNEFVQGISSTAMMNLFGLLGKLPESCQQLVVQMMNSGN